MNLEIIALLCFPGTFAAFAIAERVWPARPLPRVAWWRAKGAIFFVTMMALASFAPLLWADFFGAHRLMDLDWMGVVGGGVFAYVVLQLFAYGWHRLMHAFTPLWRLFHQMHHSAERIDVIGGVYFHPLDVVGFAFVQTAVPLALGVRVEAVLVSGIIGTVYGLFQHTNIRTPRWLGYLVQRPESHSVHHARGVHAFNYADLPLWDIVFGTFRNPERFEVEAGFWDGASAKVGAMLVARDVGTQPATSSAQPPASDETRRRNLGGPAVV